MPTVLESISAEKEKLKLKKRRIQEFLKKENLVMDGDTGLLLIHLNDGGVAKISKNMDILK